MSDTQPGDMFSLRGKIAVVTGAGGLGSAMARALGWAGARVAILSLHEESCGRVADEVRKANGEAIAIRCDVTNLQSLERARSIVHDTFGPVDIVVCGAGGNRPDATVSPASPFFELSPDSFKDVIDLNLMGVVQTCQVLGKDMAKCGSGCIITIASMSAIRPLTKVVAYSAAKAAVVNFTQWLAVHMAREYGTGIRVNAIAPGFFLTTQNSYLLVDRDTGASTPRGQAILHHTPAARFGRPEDLCGTVVWLASEASTFVTGAVIPVDGGFAADSGI